MNDVLKAMAISAGVLIPVVVFIVIITIVTVRRGEASHDMHDVLHEAVVSGPAAKAALAASDEISVPQILIIGTGLFVLTILALLGLSLLQHM